MHQKSWIRAGRAKRGGKAAQGNGDLYFLFLRPRLPCCFPLLMFSCFLFLFSSARSLDMYTCLFRRPSPFSYLTTRCLRGAIIFSFLLSVEPAVFFFFCLSLRDWGGRGLFWTSICGNQEHQGLFPSVQSIHLSAPLLLTVSASVSARGGGGVRVRGSFSFSPRPRLERA